jgi:uncharacterized protein DUF5666
MLLRESASILLGSKTCPAKAAPGAFMPKRFSLSALLAAALALSACGGASNAPTSPSTGGSGATTATISGTVRAGSPLLAASIGGAMSGLVVTVVGTNISATVDAADRFTLNGVPPGDATLRFTGAGVDSAVPLPQLRPAETVSLVLSVAGASVSIDSEIRSAAASQQLEGRVESLPPTTTANTLIVAGKTVKTDSGTRFEQGGLTKSFADLLIGMRVHVEGTASGSDITASLIRIQNTNTWIPVEVNGVIDSFAGATTMFQFKIGSRQVKGDDLTVFFGNSTFSMLKDGVRVEVKGQQRDGYIYAERIHVNVDGGTDDDAQDDSASIQGVVTSITGTKPALTLMVGGTVVRTSASTDVQRRGDTQTLDALKTGQTLHVVGVRQSNGSIEARHIFIDDDPTGGEFEIEGSVGGLKGTCPSVTFGVNGFSIATNGSTTFNGGACSTLKNGDKVTVNGVKQADGSVLAKTVKK